MIIDVLASGLHHVTRGRAAGRHYSSAGTLPRIAGIDGVGRGPNGKLRYFVQGPDQPGTMAERTVIDLRHSVELPEDADPVLIAGALNPVMASWFALRSRAGFKRGQRVLILGATGASGSAAVQVARHFEASQIVAAGRDAGRLALLPALGATDVLTLQDAELGARAAEVDVVLDFLWGEAGVRAVTDLVAQRRDRDRVLTWVHVGGMAGDPAPIPGAILRMAKVQIVGSGHGAVSGREMIAGLPELVAELSRGTFSLTLRPVPLREVESVWNDTGSGRVVLVP